MSQFNIPHGPILPVLEFNYSSASSEELFAINELIGLLRSVHSEVSRFRSAIALADIGLDRRTGPAEGEPWLEWDFRVNWSIIAAHAALSSLYQIRDLLKGLSERTSSSGLKRYFHNCSAAQQAINELNVTFPKLVQSRHATAHSGEIRSYPERNYHKAPLKRKGYLEKRGGGRMLISDTFFDRTFVTTRRGEFLSFDVTWENYKKLSDWFDRLVLRLAGSIIDPSADR